jgi:GNAT superfamily N-acetyltransferase
VQADCVEIKRMFVRETYRGRGYSRLILLRLEELAQRRGCRRVVLETGVGQPEAIGLYESAGYLRIPNYDQYAGNPNSVCLAKQT